MKIRINGTENEVIWEKKTDEGVVIGYYDYNTKSTKSVVLDNKDYPNMVFQNPTANVYHAMSINVAMGDTNTVVFETFAGAMFYALNNKSLRLSSSIKETYWILKIEVGIPSLIPV